LVGGHAHLLCPHMYTLVYITLVNKCPHMLNKSMAKKDRMITLDERHVQAVENLKNSPRGFNLSQYVRKKLEEDFPDKFDE